MDILEKLMQCGEKMGLTGEELQKFVSEQQALDREERQQRREMEKLRSEAEKLQVEAEKEKARMVAEMEKEKIKHQEANEKFINKTVERQKERDHEIRVLQMKNDNSRELLDSDHENDDKFEWTKVSKLLPKFNEMEYGTSGLHLSPTHKGQR